MGKGIPDRWHAYRAVGKPISDTRIVCFKVPLKQALVARLPWQQRFTVDNLLSQLESDNINLGLVVDLTYTTRYYHPEQFLSRSIEHQKIYTGGQVVPDESVCRQFNDVMDSFFSDDKNKDKFVGVHCTHGLNRTGYLVCRYLIEKKLMKPEDAINAFNAARGHNIERENYLEHLMQLPELLARGPLASESQVYQIDAGKMARGGKRFQGIRFVRSSGQQQNPQDDDSPEIKSIPSSEQQPHHQEYNSPEAQSIPISIQQHNHREYSAPEVRSSPNSEQQSNFQDYIPPMMHGNHFKHHHANAWQTSPFYGRQNSYSGNNRTSGPPEQRIWYGDGWTDYSFTPDYMPQSYSHTNDTERGSRSHQRRAKHSSKESRRGGSHRTRKTTPYEKSHKKGQRTS